MGVPYQDQVGQEAQAEPSHPPVDQDEDWQHHQVQRQEEALEEDQAEVVRSSGQSHPRHFLGRNVPMRRILTDFCVTLITSYDKKRSPGEIKRKSKFVIL